MSDADDAPETPISRIRDFRNAAAIVFSLGGYGMLLAFDVAPPDLIGELLVLVGSATTLILVLLWVYWYQGGYFFGRNSLYPLTTGAFFGVSLLWLSTNDASAQLSVGFTIAGAVATSVVAAWAFAGAH